jgi:hypothetical protein
MPTVITLSTLIMCSGWIGPLGEPFPADEESVSARWFDLSTVPRMSADMRRRIELASDDSRSTDTVFDTKDVPADQHPGACIHLLKSRCLAGSPRIASPVEDRPG